MALLQMSRSVNLRMERISDMLSNTTQMTMLSDSFSKAFAGFSEAARSLILHLKTAGTISGVENIQKPNSAAKDLMHP
jgi:hypothetical protein